MTAAEIRARFFESSSICPDVEHYRQIEGNILDAPRMTGRAFAPGARGRGGRSRGGGSGREGGRVGTRVGQSGRLTEEPVTCQLGARQLKAFLALAREGSFTRAASSLALSVTAVSQLVQRLEQQLQVPLFARTTRRVTMTRAGREFVPIAERLVRQLELAVETMRFPGAGQRARVTLSTFAAFAHRVLPCVVRDYVLNRTHVEIHIREREHQDIVDDVARGGSDFGVGFVDAVPAELDYVPLCRERLVVIRSARHQAGDRLTPRLSWEELAAVPLVSLASDSITRRLVDGAAAAHGVILRHAVTVGSFDSIAEFVGAGAGVGFIPEGMIQGGTSEIVKIEPAPPRLDIVLGLITRRREHLSPAAAALIALIAGRKAHLSGGVETRRSQPDESPFSYLPNP